MAYFVLYDFKQYFFYAVWMVGVIYDFYNTIVQCYNIVEDDLP